MALELGALVTRASYWSRLVKLGVLVTCMVGCTGLVKADELVMGSSGCTLVSLRYLVSIVPEGTSAARVGKEVS